jgi:thiamine biosynthesis protein ThiS
VETAETKAIHIVVNGDPCTVPKGFCVRRLLEHLAIDPGRVAVELNRSIVRKADWETAQVEDGAQVEIVWFVGGGAF